ncbi:MAG: hypothetical protein PHN75_18700 [Syntrophales bacterium]|nr:hypothetical protein [Syntrophales bacterium]
MSLLFLPVIQDKSETANGDEQDPSATRRHASPSIRPLPKRYSTIVFQDFHADPKIEAEYPGVVAECKNAAVEAVKAKNIFSVVVVDGSTPTLPNTILVKARVLDLKIMSTASRFWDGPLGNRSDMIVTVEFVDAASGKVMREKRFSLRDNPNAAAWTTGWTDRTLPHDMGVMIADYIDKLRPRR